MAQRYGHWSILDIDPTHDDRAIKRAYAAKLKGIDVGADPKAFIALRAAFEGAREAAKWMEPPETLDGSDEDSEQYQSLAQDDLNPKTRVLRFAPQGKLDGKERQEPRPKIRVKPAGAKNEGAQQEAASPKSRIKPKKPAAASDSLDLERDGDEQPKIHFKPKPKTPLSNYDEDKQEEEAFEIEATPAWYQEPEDRQAAEIIMERIAILLNGDATGLDYETAIEDSFLDLLAAPELENIGQRDVIETRIASMALNAGERGYYLVLLVHWHFGWHEREQDYDLVWPIDEVVNLAPAITRLRKLETPSKGIWQTEWQADSYSYSCLKQAPPPLWNPLYWIRQGQVRKFIDSVRTETPALIGMIGYDHVAAWQPGPITGSRLILLLVALIYSTVHWLGELAFSVKPDFPISIWFVMLFFTGVISGTIVSTEFSARAREKEDPFRAQIEPHNGKAFLALAALGLQTLIFGLLPPSSYLALASIPVAMLLFYFTHNPILRLPVRDRFFMVARRMTIGAFIIIAVATFKLSPLVYLQTIIPAVFFLWSAARMHESVQTWFDAQHFVQRWMLNLIVLFAAAIILYSQILIVPPANMPPPYLYIYGAMLLVVIHDLITARDAEIPGSKFIILPILTLAMTVLYPIPVMMAVIILRTGPVLYIAFCGHQAAAKSGRQWQDHGGGYSSNGSFGQFTILGHNTKSIWFWIWMAIMAFQIIRVFAALDKTTTPNPMFVPPGPSAEEIKRERQKVLEEMFQEASEKTKDDIEKSQQALKPETPIPPPTGPMPQRP